MMKRIIFVILSIFFTTVLAADIVNHNIKKDSYNINLYTKDTLISGNNDFFVKLSKNGTVIDNAKVKIKVFMPEMPGMPYMEYKAKAKLINGVYKMMINFSMGGTWQYHLKFKTIDKKVHTIRGSVNI